MGGWGGIIGSAIAGGMAGAGNAVASIGATQMKADEEKQRMTWQEAKDKRMKEMDFANQEVRDERLAGRQEQSDTRKAEREDKKWAEQSAREEKRWEEQGIRESERERLRNEREAAREAARDARYEKSQSGANKRVSVVDSEGAPRMVTQEELNSAPAGKYKLVATDQQDKRMDAGEEKNFAGRIAQKEKQVNELTKYVSDPSKLPAPAKQAVAELAAMKSEYGSRFGKSYGGDAPAASAGPWEKYGKGK